jgi:hypothetical protein
MAVQKNVTDEERVMLNILIDDDIQSESSGGSNCSQKRKAAGAVDDDQTKHRSRVSIYILCIIHLDVTDKELNEDDL